MHGASGERGCLSAYAFVLFNGDAVFILRQAIRRFLYSSAAEMAISNSKVTRVTHWTFDLWAFDSWPFDMQ